MSRWFRGVSEKRVPGDVLRGTLRTSNLGGLNMVGLQWVGVKMPPWHPFARSKLGGWGSVRRTDIGKKRRVGDHHMTSTAGRMEFLSWKKDSESLTKFHEDRRSWWFVRSHGPEVVFLDMSGLR